MSQIQIEKSEIVVRDHPDDDYLKGLFLEYQVLVNRIENFDNRILQFTGGGLTVLATLFAFVVTEGKTKVEPLVLFFSPIFFYVFYWYLFNLFYHLMQSVGQATYVTSIVNEIMGKETFIAFNNKLLISRITNPKDGSVKFRILFGILIASLILVLFLYVLYCFSIIFTKSNFLGSIFLLKEFITFAITYYIFIGIYSDTQSISREFIDNLNSKAKISKHLAREEVFGNLSKELKKIFFIIFPRPKDIIFKGSFFWYGFFISAASVNPSYSFLSVINFFQISNLDFSGQKINLDSFYIEPITLFFVGIVYFVFEECILQQAKLLWDDIRDSFIDKNLPNNQFRAIQMEFLSEKTAINHVIIRLIMSFTFCIVIKNYTLLIVFLLIIFHQAIYVFFVKHLPKEHSIFKLLFVSLNTPLRFLTGLAAFNENILTLNFAIVSLILCWFISMASMSKFYSLESIELTIKNKKLRIHGDYFKKIEANFFSKYILNIAPIVLFTIFYLNNPSNLNRIVLFLILQAFAIYVILLNLVKIKNPDKPLLFDIPKLVVLIMYYIFYFSSLLLLYISYHSYYSDIVQLFFPLCFYFHLTLFDDIKFKEFAMTNLSRDIEKTIILTRDFLFFPDKFKRIQQKSKIPKP